MRWNQLADDIPRALALAEILCGAGHADATFELSERFVVGGMLLKVLGVTKLPQEVEAFVTTFDPDKLNLVDACARLNLATDRDKASLVKVVADVVKADEKVDKAERNFVTRLGKALGIPAADVKALLG